MLAYSVSYLSKASTPMEGNACPVMLTLAANLKLCVYPCDVYTG